MKNKLEGFVKEHKKQFEVQGPSDQLWGKISAALDEKETPKKSIKLYHWLSVAAMLAISLSIYFNYNQTAKNTNITVADVNLDYGKKAVRFTNQIEEKKDSLGVYAKENPELYSKFTIDLQRLDADYEKLKKELQTTPNRPFVVKAMMKNLEIRNQILSQQLQIINQVDQFNKENSI